MARADRRGGDANAPPPRAANIVIDARSLLPPEPLVRTLTALDDLDDEGELTLILDRRPHLLLPILASNGYRWDEAEDADGVFQYRISKR